MLYVFICCVYIDINIELFLDRNKDKYMIEGNASES